MDKQELEYTKKTLERLHAQETSCEAGILLGMVKKLEDERDRYKARCEAMEECLRTTGWCCGCKYWRWTKHAEGCTHEEGYDACTENSDRYEFDEVRFAPEKEANHEAD